MTTRDPDSPSSLPAAREFPRRHAGHARTGTACPGGRAHGRQPGRRQRGQPRAPPAASRLSRRPGGTPSGRKSPRHARRVASRAMESCPCDVLPSSRSFLSIGPAHQVRGHSAGNRSAFDYREAPLAGAFRIPGLRTSRRQGRNWSAHHIGRLRTSSGDGAPARSLTTSSSRPHGRPESQFTGARAAARGRNGPVRAAPQH